MTRKKQRGIMVLLTLYRATSYDIIFFYPIQLIFLYQTRGISLAQNVFLESCFWLFNFVFMTVATIISEKITTKQATVAGSILWIISVLIYLQPASSYYYYLLLLAEVIRALGLSQKSEADFALIRDVLEQRGLYDNSLSGQKNYSSVEGNAMAINCTGDAIVAFLSAKLMAISPNLAMWLCLASCIYGLVLSCMLPSQPKHNKPISTEDKKSTTYRSIMSNKVIATVVIHVFIVYGTFCYWENLGKNLLQEIQVTAWTYGIIMTLLYVSNSLGGIIAGKRVLQSFFASRKKFIAFITFFNLGCMLILGILGLSTAKIAIIMITVILIIQSMIKTSYITDMKLSLQKQANRGINKKISNLLFSSEHLGKAITMAIASGIVEVSSTAKCYIALTAILLIPCILISKKVQLD